MFNFFLLFTFNLALIFILAAFRGLQSKLRDAVTVG